MKMSERVPFVNSGLGSSDLGGSEAVSRGPAAQACRDGRVLLFRLRLRRMRSPASQSILENFANFLAGSFSAVSKPMFTSK